MYELITVKNNPATAGVKVSVAWDGTRDISALTKVQLRRYVNDSENYTVVYENNITTTVDLTYTYEDIDTFAGYTYRYDACVINQYDIRWGGAEASIVCAFDGIMLADQYGSWHTAFGTSESNYSLGAKKNRPVSYITTLSGKYPHRVSNSRANYWTGGCTALWLPAGEVCDEPTIKDAERYRRAFIEWLMSDTEKLMKTSDGRAMIISIDDGVQENWSAYAGLSTVTFEWTQIGEVNQEDNYVPKMGKGWVSE